MGNYNPLYTIILFLFFLFPIIRSVKRKNFTRLTGLFLLFLYSNILMTATMPTFILVNGCSPALGPPVNLIPFASIHYMLAHDSTGTALRQIGGNILLFMPLGFLLPIVNQKYKKPVPILITVFCVSLSIEIIQFLFYLITGVPDRVSDVDDILLNVTGGALGWLCFLAADKLLFSKLFRKLKNNV